MKALIFLIFISYSLQAQTEMTPTVLDPAYGQKIESYLSHTVDLVDVEELYKKQENYTLIDVRKKEEYKTSHLKGATWLSPDTDLSKRTAFSKDKPILVYCSVGARSEDMGEQFKDLGYEVYNLYGGILEWVNRDYPVYKKENDLEVRSHKIHTFNFMFRPYVTNKKYKKVGLLNW